jgi:chromate transporter
MSRSSIWEIFKVSIKLGLTSFGGPVAHLGYFREEYVRRKQWLGEKEYADLVALCQFLPGPASSQTGIGIGFLRGGWLGAVLAWLGFTLPSVVALALFAYLCKGWGLESAGWIHGLKIAAVAIVAQAVWGMSRQLAPDRARTTIALLTAIASLLANSAVSQVIFIAIGAFLGLLLYRNAAEEKQGEDLVVPVSPKLAIAALILFFVLLAGLPLLRLAYPEGWIAMFDSFYRAGALVFGGGHVVLPLLEKEVVPAGWMTEEQFLAGYGAAQAVPGPLFTFAAYLGMVMKGWLGAVVATLAIFLPAFLLVAGVLPFWASLRKQEKVKRALFGMNAVVVGILLAALYDPIWINTVRTTGDFCLAIAAFAMLIVWKLPPWMIVVFSALGGLLISIDWRFIS